MRHRTRCSSEDGFEGFKRRLFGHAPSLVATFYDEKMEGWHKRMGL
jgi:hypothetical protein